MPHLLGLAWPANPDELATDRRFLVRFEDPPKFTDRQECHLSVLFDYRPGTNQVFIQVLRPGFGGALVWSITMQRTCVEKLGRPHAVWLEDCVRQAQSSERMQ